MSEPLVLLVDDEKHIRLLLRQCLAGMNCKVIWEAADGEEAIFLVNTFHP
ncbi:MAG: hypothetical protein HOD90_02505 [Nitrospina sp.]|jgi:CheY-like chemotaxis protein|nr:hypothetical protein [Nitrospina sp.]MBT6514263.1 hypothetical protein [Crocinitomicaceae bacterium]